MFTEHGVHSLVSDILPLFDLSSVILEKESVNSATFKTSEYLFIYLLKGNGELYINNRKQPLNSGDFVVCRPFESKEFTPFPEDPCEYFAVSFNGRYCTDLLSNLKIIPKKNYFVGRDTEMISLLDKVYEEVGKNDSTAYLIGSSLFVSV